MAWLDSAMMVVPVQSSLLCCRHPEHTVFPGVSRLAAGAEGSIDFINVSHIKREKPKWLSSIEKSCSLYLEGFFIGVCGRLALFVCTCCQSVFGACICSRKRSALKDSTK